MNDRSDRPRSLKRTAALTLAFTAGPPASFVLLSPLIALLGYATGWFAPAVIGNAVGVILIGAAVAMGFALAALAVAAVVVALIGTTAMTAYRVIAHIFSRLP